MFCSLCKHLHSILMNKYFIDFFYNSYILLLKHLEYKYLKPLFAIMHKFSTNPKIEEFLHNIWSNILSTFDCHLIFKMH